jgi:hypothetical protein
VIQSCFELFSGFKKLKKKKKKSEEEKTHYLDGLAQRATMTAFNSSAQIEIVYLFKQMN